MLTGGRALEAFVQCRTEKEITPFLESVARTTTSFEGGELK